MSVLIGTLPAHALQRNTSVRDESSKTVARSPPDSSYASARRWYIYDVNKLEEDKFRVSNI